MATLKNQVQYALDELRILMLGTQVLVGFQYQAVFQRGFPHLPSAVPMMHLVALGLLLVTLGFLVAPATYRHLADGAQDSLRLIRFARRACAVGLLPLLGGLGIDLFIMVTKACGRTFGLVLSTGLVGIGLFLWYGLGILSLWIRKGDGALAAPREEAAMQGIHQETGLSDRIKHVLTEARVVLPGAQALLGFQLAIVWTDSFTQMGAAAKLVHVASLGQVTLAVLLLMMPAAFHRIAERGEETERFHRLASAVLLLALVPLALGLCGDLFVLLYKISGALALSIGVALGMVGFFWILWFGYPLYVRRRPL